MNTTRCVRITIRGRLTPRLVSTFDGLTAEDSMTGTRLVGRISDQAQLHGLLSRIRDLGLDLESVVTGDVDDGSGPSAGAVAPTADRAAPNREASW